MTALQLQRLYLRACQQFLERRPDAPDEAHEVVAAWEEVLDALEQLQLTGEAPQSLIGAVDWVTKKHLLEEAGRDASLGSAQEDRHLLSRTVAARIFPDAAGGRIGRRLCQPAGTGTRHADAAGQLRRPPCAATTSASSRRTRDRTVRQLEARRDRPWLRQQVDSTGALRSSGRTSRRTRRVWALTIPDVPTCREGPAFSSRTPCPGVAG